MDPVAVVPGGGGACALVFALIDPLDVAIFGHVPPGTGFYTVSFFVLWVMAGLSSALTAYLMPKPREDDEL